MAWKRNMMLSFVLWSIGLILLFCNWYKISVYDFEMKIPVYQLYGYMKEMVDELFYFNYRKDGIILGITLACVIAFYFFLLLFACITAYRYYREDQRMFKSGKALAITQIIFALAFIIVMSAAMNQDALMNAMTSFTAAPYAIIIINIAAIAAVSMAKKYYELTEDAEQDKKEAKEKLKKSRYGVVDEDGYVSLVCPECGQELSFTKQELDAGGLICPWCENEFEFSNSVCQ